MFNYFFSQFAMRERPFIKYVLHKTHSGLKGEVATLKTAKAVSGEQHNELKRKCASLEKMNQAQKQEVMWRCFFLIFSFKFDIQTEIRYSLCAKD